MAEQERVAADPKAAPGASGSSHGQHEAPEGAPLHPLIDLSRDPNPGQPAHAKDEPER
jgi:hypothetical protein